jgi:post-segregation antitoxin (ccd killing protein)
VAGPSVATIFVRRAAIVRVSHELAQAARPRAISISVRVANADPPFGA